MAGSKKQSVSGKNRQGRDAKKKDKSDSGPKKAEITVMVKADQAMQIVQKAKVITVQDLARQLGVKISAANAFLKESVASGAVKRVGGYSGHYLYQSAS